MQERDVYICEYRLDKTAHLFNPISRNKYPISTKSYAFDKFEQKLVPKRDYSVSSWPSFSPWRPSGFQTKCLPVLEGSRWNPQKSRGVWVDLTKPYHVSVTPLAMDSPS